MKLYDSQGQLKVSMAGGGGGGNGNQISAGTQLAGAASTVVFSNSNGITFGMSNSSVVTASHNGLTTAALSNHSHGNPQLNLTNLSGTTASNSAGFTLSLSAAAAGGAQTGISGVQVSNTTYTSGTVTFQNANGISFGSSGVNGISASYTVPSTAGLISAIGVTGQNGNFTGTGISFSNVNGVSFGTSAGSAITASHNGLTSQSNQAASAANGSFAFQTISFSNVNGISFGTSAGSAITASHNAITTGRASNDGIGLNTAQSNVTWTVNSAGLSFDARGYAGTNTTFNGANVSGSMTVNSNGVNLSMSVAAPGGGGETRLTAYANSNTTQSSSGTIALSSVNFAGAGIASVGITNGSVVVSVPAGGGGGDGGVFAGVSNLGNTAGSTGTVSTGNFVLVGSNGISLSQSTGAAGSAATVTILGDQRTISGLFLCPLGGMGGPLPFAQSSISLGQNSLYVYPFQLEDNLTIDHIRMPVMVTNSSSAAASIQKGYTYQFAIYTRNNTNNTVLTRHYSTSYTLAASHNSNASWMLSMITAIGNSTSYNTLTASSAGINLSSSCHGPREFIMPVSSLLSPGEYWFALLASTSSVGGAGSILQLSNLAVAYQTYNRLGLATNATNSGFFQFVGAGTYSVTTGAIPGGISQTQINQLGTLPILFAATGTV